MVARKYVFCVVAGVIFVVCWPLLPADAAETCGSERPLPLDGRCVGRMEAYIACTDRLLKSSATEGDQLKRAGQLKIDLQTIATRGYGQLDLVDDARRTTARVFEGTPFESVARDIASKCYDLAVGSSEATKSKSKNQKLRASRASNHGFVTPSPPTEPMLTFQVGIDRDNGSFMENEFTNPGSASIRVRYWSLATWKDGDLQKMAGDEQKWMRGFDGAAIIPPGTTQYFGQMTADVAARKNIEDKIAQIHGAFCAIYQPLNQPGIQRVGEYWYEYVPVAKGCGHATYFKYDDRPYVGPDGDECDLARRMPSQLRSQLRQ
jgi:hypothetical protein